MPKEASGPKNYPCTVDGCPLWFTRPQDVTRHVKKKHEKEQAELFVCKHPKCKKGYKSPFEYNFDRHMKKHEREDEEERMKDDEEDEGEGEDQGQADQTPPPVAGPSRLAAAHTAVPRNPSAPSRRASPGARPSPYHQAHAARPAHPTRVRNAMEYDVRLDAEMRMAAAGMPGTMNPPPFVNRPDWQLDLPVPAYPNADAPAFEAADSYPIQNIPFPLTAAAPQSHYPGPQAYLPGPQPYPGPQYFPATQMYPAPQPYPVPQQYFAPQAYLTAYQQDEAQVPVAQEPMARAVPPLLPLPPALPLTELSTQFQGLPSAGDEETVPADPQDAAATEQGARSLEELMVDFFGSGSS
ncbi:hypothetical protein AURDEDRAFT_168391 [Auricularia subglabra TFB-10046 SS5]|nr:hypothetical protein AURDEDRAFT_168391 [Auricularia subglabra TFB-10046 SS5]